MIEELIYLASPFSTEDRIEKEVRFLKSCDCCAVLMEAGHMVFSPIAFGWPVAKMRDMRTDWEYWEKVCRAYISRCQSMAVLMLDGWKDSTGVKAEMDIAEELGIPIVYVDPTDYKIYNNPIGDF